MLSVSLGQQGVALQQSKRGMGRGDEDGSDRLGGVPITHLRHARRFCQSRRMRLITLSSPAQRLCVRGTQIRRQCAAVRVPSHIPVTRRSPRLLLFSWLHVSHSLLHLSTWQHEESPALSPAAGQVTAPAPVQPVWTPLLLPHPSLTSLHCWCSPSNVQPAAGRVPGRRSTHLTSR